MLQKHASDTIGSNRWLTERDFDIKIESTIARLKVWYMNMNLKSQNKSVINHYHWLGTANRL